MVEAIKRDFPQQREIADASYRYQQEVDSGESGSWSASTGTACESEERSNAAPIDPAFERKQIERLQAVRARARRARSSGAGGAEGGGRHRART